MPHECKKIKFVPQNFLISSANYHESLVWVSLQHMHLNRNLKKYYKPSQIGDAVNKSRASIKRSHHRKHFDGFVYWIILKWS